VAVWGVRHDKMNAETSAPADELKQLPMNTQPIPRNTISSTGRAVEAVKWGEPYRCNPKSAVLKGNALISTYLVIWESGILWKMLEMDLQFEWPRGSRPPHLAKKTPVVAERPNFGLKERDLTGLRIWYASCKRGDPSERATLSKGPHRCDEALQCRWTWQVRSRDMDSLEEDGDRICVQAFWLVVCQLLI
jgi:hypothetical protein